MSENAERLGPPLGADPDKPGPEKTVNSRNTVKRLTTISILLDLRTNNRRPSNSSAWLGVLLVLLAARDVFNPIKRESDLLGCPLGGNGSVLVN